IRALVEGEPDLELIGHSSNHHKLLEELESLQPDTLLIDLSLYSAKNFDFLRSIRDTYPDLKIILFSVHTDSRYVDKATGIGVDAYILKTEDPTQIIDAIRAVQSGKPYISKNIDHTPKESAAAIDSPINLLSRQQFQILQRIGKGENNRQISEE